jgi:hypothetical protein
MSESSSTIAADAMPQIPIWQRGATVLRALASHDATLLLGLLALNALVLPYKGIVHDSMLYCYQVANHIEGGRYADDIYFRYGSQDQYTIFSSLVLPLARLVGLSTAFFLLYVPSKIVFLWASMRLVRTLVADRLVSTLALIFIATVPLTFGGLSIFSVNEDFLTPRLLSSALTILAMEQALRDRLIAPLALLLGALLIHPLMAFPGLLVCLGWIVTGRLSRSWAAGIIVSLGALTGVVLGYQDLGVRLFGYMDAEWHDAIRRAAFVNTPAEWQYEDWLRIGVSAGILMVGCFSTAFDGPKRRFLALVLLVGLGGLAGAVLACHLPYALLMHGQPWRALWLLEFVKVPVAFFLVADAWAGERPLARLASLVVIAYLAVSSHGVAEVIVVLIAFPVLAIFFRGLTPLPREKDWLWQSAVFSLVLGLMMRELMRFVGLVNGAQWAELAGAPQDQVFLVLRCADPWLRLVIGILLLLLLYQLCGDGRLFAAVAATAFLVLQFGHFAVPLTDWYARRFPKPGSSDVAVVDAFLKEKWHEERPPTIYWPGAHWRAFWFDLHANCYFEWPNAVTGLLFSRGQALEAIRRAELLKSFEIDRLRRPGTEWHEEPFKGWAERLYRADLDSQPAPSFEDLQRLCLEEKVDFVVLPQKFEGLYAASQGEWFIYDCRTICANTETAGSEKSCCEP